MIPAAQIGDGVIPIPPGADRIGGYAIGAVFSVDDQCESALAAFRYTGEFQLQDRAAWLPCFMMLVELGPFVPDEGSPTLRIATFGAFFFSAILPPPWRPYPAEP